MIARPVYLEKLIRYKDKDLIKVITGIRRCGKSVLLFDIYARYLLDLGIPEDHILKINLENKENSPLREADALYQFILNRISGSGKYYVMIDEIQYVTGFEDLVNSLKNKGCDVYITGSNSRLLSGDISTALRGRSIEIKVYTLSFAEYASTSADDHRKAFNDYLLYGGFPYAATEPDTRSKVDYLKMLESTVATRDIIDRYHVRNTNLFYSVYDFLCSNIGSTVSAKKITDTLRSNGYSSLSPDTVDSYLQYLCEAFLFYKVYRYDIRGREYLKTQNKYYISDLGLRNVRLNYRQLEITHSLENIIYLELIRRGYRVDIGKNKEKEIDFIASSSRDSYYIQAAYTLAGEDKKKQELDSFRNIADGYKKIVITMDEDPFIILENGFKKINVIDFLLNADSLETI
ncbi:MAG: ATP-binding protein [Verrucomicrobia bacterium]|nr:ATP-binding protein [Verrucomicrobiota bacterium]